MRFPMPSALTSTMGCWWSTTAPGSVADQRRYSPAQFVSAQRRTITGGPEMAKISTSHVERANLTMNSLAALAWLKGCVELLFSYSSLSVH